MRETARPLKLKRARFVLPHPVARVLNRRHVNSPLQEFAKWIVPYHIWNRLRQKRLDASRARQLATAPPARTGDYSCDAAIDFLASIGCDRPQVVAGSMPQSSLDYARTFIPPDAQRGLHVGNFVGVSLAYFIHALGGGDAVVTAIDPNIMHRGIANPSAKVLALLSRFGLEKGCLLVTGYSLERNVANDGRDYAGGFAADAFSTEASCANALPHLARIAPAGFDFAVMDGNHDGTYLRRELREVATLLRPGGVLVLDDVSSEWFEIERVYADLDAPAFEKLGTDGRVGVLRKNA